MTIETREAVVAMAKMIAELIDINRAMNDRISKLESQVIMLAHLVENKEES